MDLHYNAFISYRHHPEDIKVAETIHRSLERFRVPKALKKQGKSIDRIFRDKEELPITSSLTDTITMALRNSDYQIVICSTHLKGSYWVQREIETFLQTHTKDKVLTVLVDGDNPYDVIPEILTYNEVIDPVTGEVTREPIEPLSCDWRMSRRKAMKTELPRLAAVLLGCTYDDLIQRQKQYRQRRLIAGISTGMAASLALAGYFLYTSIQIQENLDQSLRNQSQYLASTSQTLLSKGDRLTALALALEALPQDGDRPYVPAAEQALSKALLLYEPQGDLISVAAFNAESAIENIVISDDGHTLYVLDQQFNVTAWDTVDRTKLSTFNIGGFRALNSTLLTDAHSNLLTLGGTDGKTLMCYSREGTLLWEMEHVEDIAFYTDKQTLLAIHRIIGEDITLPQTFELLELDSESGTPTGEPLALFHNKELSAPSFTAELYYDGLPVSVDGYAPDNGHRVLTADPNTKTIRTVLSYNSLFYGSSVTEDGRLYLLITETGEAASGRLNNYYFHTQSGGLVCCIDMHSGRELWRTAVTSYNYSNANSIAPIHGTDRLFCQYGSAFLQMDAKSGRILAECHSTSIPLALNINETYVWILFNDGCTSNYTFDTNTLGHIQYMESGLLMGKNNQGVYVVPQSGDSVLLYRTTSDTTYNVFSGEYDDYIASICRSDTHLATAGMGYVNVFDLNTQSLLWRCEADYAHEVLGFSSDGSTLYTRDGSAIVQFDVLTGEAGARPLPLKTETEGFTMHYNAITYAEDLISCLAYSTEDTSAHILFYDCITGESSISPIVLEENTAKWIAYDYHPRMVHVTDTYALFCSGAGDLCRFDRATGETSVFIAEYGKDPVFLDDGENGRMVFSTPDGILVTDRQFEPVLNIPLTDAFAVSFFYYEDQLLCLASDGMTYRFDEDGNKLGTIGMSLYSSYFTQTNNINSQKVPVSWSVTPDRQVVVNAFRIGNVIDTEAWDRVCDVKQLLFYHEPTDSYIIQSNDMIYAYQRCTLEDLTARAQEALGLFTLSDTQRAYYGLNES